jgi:hypothetical protein
MNFIKRMLARWVSEGRATMRVAPPSVTETSAASIPQEPHFRFGVLSVMNGRVLEVCTHKRNPHGPDWTTTYWVLNEQQPLAEQLAVVMTMKGLEK